MYSGFASPSQRKRGGERLSGCRHKAKMTKKLIPDLHGFVFKTLRLRFHIANLLQRFRLGKT